MQASQRQSASAAGVHETALTNFCVKHGPWTKSRLYERVRVCRGCQKILNREPVYTRKLRRFPLRAFTLIVKVAFLTSRRRQTERIITQGKTNTREVPSFRDLKFHAMSAHQMDNAGHTANCLFSQTALLHICITRERRFCFSVF